MVNILWLTCYCINFNLFTNIICYMYYSLSDWGQMLPILVVKVEIINHISFQNKLFISVQPALVKYFLCQAGMAHPVAHLSYTVLHT